MHQVFLKYYNNAHLENFFKDISKKQYVLLMRAPDTGRIVGFSTIALLDLEYQGRKVLGLFSGDTILEREYWGSRRWQLTWGLFCLRLKLANPRTPFFWLLISKGYKTYMLMANNFINYYPPHRQGGSRAGQSGGCVLYAIIPGSLRSPATDPGLWRWLPEPAGTRGGDRRGSAQKSAQDSLFRGT